jgi:hypothetical protein
MENASLTSANLSIEPASSLDTSNSILVNKVNSVARLVSDTIKYLLGIKSYALDNMDLKLKRIFLMQLLLQLMKTNSRKLKLRNWALPEPKYQKLIRHYFDESGGIAPICR